MEERKMVEQKVNQRKCEQRKEELNTTHEKPEKEVKKGVHKDKRHVHDTLTSEAEQIASRRELATLYQITRS
ncbi:unnamed protein product [Heterobilharzia americana]|nr:unnamed protein product [Heterobilharzia americana]